MPVIDSSADPREYCKPRTDDLYHLFPLDDLHLFREDTIPIRTGIIYLMWPW